MHIASAWRVQTNIACSLLPAAPQNWALRYAGWKQHCSCFRTGSTRRGYGHRTALLSNCSPTATLELSHSSSLWAGEAAASTHDAPASELPEFTAPQSSLWQNSVNVAWTTSLWLGQHTATFTVAAPQPAPQSWKVYRQAGSIPCHDEHFRQTPVHPYHTLCNNVHTTPGQHASLPPACRLPVLTWTSGWNAVPQLRPRARCNESQQSQSNYSKQSQCNAEVNMK